MVQIYKPFCFVVFALLLLQLTDANSDEKKKKSPFLKKIDKIVNTSSKTVRKAKEAANIVGKEIGKLADEFKDQLNADYQAEREKDGKDLIPKAIKYNIIQPGGAAAKILFKRVASGVDSFVSDVNETYDKYKDGEKKLSIVGNAPKTYMIGAAITNAAKHQAKKYIDQGISFWKDGDPHNSAEDKKDKSAKKKDKSKKKKKDSEPKKDEDKIPE